MSIEPTPEAPAQTMALVSTAHGPLAFLTDTAAFNHLWRIATAYAKSSIVPQHLRGHQEDCFILCQMAIRMDVDPFMLMQQCYVVHGKPGFSGQFCIARLNSSGKIRGTVKTEFAGVGDDYGCTAWAIDRETGEKITGPKITLRIVKAEGWMAKDGSKWKTMPEMMYIYRAAAWFIRANYPEVLMGMATVEELNDSLIDVQSYEVEQAAARPLAEKVAAAAKAFSATAPDVERPAETATAPDVERPAETLEEPIAKLAASAATAIAKQSAAPPKRGRPPKAKPEPEPEEGSSDYADLRDEYQQRMAGCKTFDAAAGLVHQAFTDPKVIALPREQADAIQAACVAKRNEHLAAPVARSGPIPLRTQTSLIK
jgi:hypothetical protein